MRTSQASILIVEDEALLAAEIEARLRALGYSIAGIADKQDDAIELAHRTLPSLVLLDIVLKQGGSGIEVAAELRKMQIPVVFITANSDRDTLHRAKINHPFGFLLKPFDERDLVTSIEIAMHNHRQEMERELLVERLQEALQEIKTLSGLLPICSECKKIKDEAGKWQRLENYVSSRTRALFSHGYCPECAQHVLKQARDEAARSVD